MRSTYRNSHRGNNLVHADHHYHVHVHVRDNDHHNNNYHHHDQDSPHYSFHISHHLLHLFVQQPLQTHDRKYYTYIRFVILSETLRRSKLQDPSQHHRPNIFIYCYRSIHYFTIERVHFGTLFRAILYKLIIFNLDHSCGVVTVRFGSVFGQKNV